MTIARGERTMANFITHEPCPNCNSKDNLARYDDDSAYCFGCEYFETADGEEKSSPTLPSIGVFKALKTRHISEQTCRKYNYRIGEVDGKPCHVMDYGCAFKFRFKDKTFAWRGEAKKTKLFGENIFRSAGKKIVITEGEIDCLTVSQVFGNKYPVVSIKNGAASAEKDCKNSLEFLQAFSEVVICFDQDAAGQTAARKVAELFAPSQAKIVKLPMKDPNEMLVNNKVADLISAIYDAKTYRPDGIIDGSSLFEQLTTQTQSETVPYPYKELNKMTHGLRKGELVTITAGSGIGKSLMCKEIAFDLVVKHNKKIGYIALEESVKKTALGLLSIDLDTPLHISAEVAPEILQKSFDKVLGSGNVLFYDHFGSLESENLIGKIRYLAKGCMCDFIILDHISIVVSGLEGGDERRAIDNAMTRLRSLVEETGIGLILVSHLKRPSEKGHEEGAQTSLSQLRGSAGIGQLSDIVLGLERNQQSNKNSNTTTLRILKNRFSGETGTCGQLVYNPITGRLIEYEKDTKN
jgi:twinkle protein